MKYLSIALLTAVMLLGAAAVGNAGVYHAGGALLCYDCHTMHFSMQHGWDGGAVANTPTAGGNWLSANGPNHYLLKAPVNELCLACHNGTSVAPDVLEANFNAASPNNRSAGALNVGTAPYNDWKGHTLGPAPTPPGFKAGGTWGGDLECTNCHTQHGRAGAYRNLGPRSIPEADLSFEISTTNNTSKHVWINIAGLTGTPGARTPAEWSNFYDGNNIFYNRIDAPAATNWNKSSNGISKVCATCHYDFHGGPQDAGVGGVAAGSAWEEFIRHPNAQVNIGALTGGHSNLSRFVAATNKVKVATVDYTAYTNSSPICQSCHKSHGNQNPFGLIFMNRTGTISANHEEGGETNPVAGIRNLCGQCHVQGN